MSLVHDALEKAKREAAAKSARELGLAEARVGAGQPFRGGRRIHPATAAAAAAAVTLGLVGALLLWSRPATTAPAALDAPAPSALPSASPPTVVEPAAVVNGSPAPAPAAAAPALGAASSSVEEPAATPPSPAPSPATESAIPVPGSTRAPDPAPNRAASAPASFVRQTTLADGTVVRLGGIAWSQEAPLAYLNGKLYAKGESVAGLLIERIERERVVLAGGSGRIVLTLR